MPRIRQNIVTAEWVVVATARAKRPDDFAKRPFSSGLIHDAECIFCRGHEAWQSRIPEASTPHIYVMPNKFPAFSQTTDISETGHNFYQDSESIGIHEVVVLINPRDALPQISSERLFELLQVLQERAKTYESDPTISSIIPIYNHGHEAGASVSHPHAQIFATALVPPRLAHEFFGAEQYHHKHRTCVFCGMIKFELKDNERIITKRHGALAFASYAPRFPFETYIIPTHHVHAFSDAPASSLKACAETLCGVLHTMANKLNDPPLNWYIRSARHIDEHRQVSYHWHIKICPRITTFGGFELASDMIIETVLPEVAAQFLRD